MPCLGFLSTSGGCLVTPLHRELSWDTAIPWPMMLLALECPTPSLHTISCLLAKSCLTGLWEISREMMEAAAQSLGLPHPCRRDEGKWWWRVGPTGWWQPRLVRWALSRSRSPAVSEGSEGVEINSSHGIKVSVAMVMPKNSPSPRLSGLWSNKNFFHSRASG